MTINEYVNKMFCIKGKTAIVTGGSGSLGNMVATGYALQGAKVMLVDLEEERIRQSCEELKKQGCECAYAAGNLTDEETVRAIVDKTVREFGELNILCACHGFNKPRTIDEQSFEEWKKIMDINTGSIYLLAKYAGEQMIKQEKGGKMIITSSVRSKRGYKGYTGYCSSKGAVDMMVQSLACDLGQYNIQVNSINPSVFRSALTAWMWDDTQARDNYTQRIPAGRLGEPEDFIGITTFLASSASDYITASNYPVDGGYWSN